MSLPERLEEQRVRTVESLLEEPVPGFLFDGFFRDNSITVIEAPSHRGKSMLMLDMALCLDLELPLFGLFKPLRGRDVLILGADAPPWDYRLQIQKLCIGHDISPERRKQIRILGKYERGINVLDPDIQRLVRTVKQETGASVLCIDSHRATHNQDENSSTGMKHVWDVLCGWRDAGWAVVMTHHVGKMNEMTQVDVHTGRGSSVIADSSDFKYVLTKRSRTDPKINITCTKGRGGGEDDPINSYSMLYVPSNEFVNGKPIKGIKLAAETAGSALDRFIATGPKNRQDIETFLLSQTNDPRTIKKFADNRLQELRRQGKIDTDGRGTWRVVNPAE